MNNESNKSEEQEKDVVEVVIKLERPVYEAIQTMASAIMGDEDDNLATLMEQSVYGKLVDRRSILATTMSLAQLPDGKNKLQTLIVGRERAIELLEEMLNSKLGKKDE